MTTAELVRSWRLERGLSQAQLAEQAGTAQAVISRIELGKLNPTVPVLERLANAMDLDVVLAFAPRGR
ncbi:helix-turn-helix domain-containing protein [Streptacidiphilus sp. EB129]|uniref:helix-turn-helix domain-containing protein n=1 Tax=Streptacidiphilus sp. EB129 TaxID=3156262 RepID=UPI00351277F2